MCLGKSPLSLLSSAIGAQHRVKARVQGGTLFFLTMQMHVFLNAFLFIIPLAFLFLISECISPLLYHLQHSYVMRRFLLGMKLREKE